METSLIRNALSMSTETRNILHGYVKTRNIRARLQKWEYRENRVSYDSVLRGFSVHLPNVNQRTTGTEEVTDS